MGLGRILRAHFDLGRRPPREYAAQGSLEPGPRGSRLSPALYTGLHYLCLVAGVVGKFFIEAARGGSPLDWTSLASAGIMAAVVFPYVCRKVCDPAAPHPMQFFVSFQHGFFIQTVLEQAQRLL